MPEELRLRLLLWWGRSWGWARRRGPGEGWFGGLPEGGGASGSER